MIYGHGVDIQCTQKMEEVITRRGDRFLKKVFSDSEINYCKKHRKPFEHYAARWAIKEAFLKALGSGIGSGFLLRDIEIFNHESGKPDVLLNGKTKIHCDKLGIKVHTSLSHSKMYAVGSIILTKE